MLRGLSDTERHDLKCWEVVEEALRHRDLGPGWTDDEIRREKIRWLSYSKWKEAELKREMAEALRELEKTNGTNKTHMITISLDQGLPRNKETVALQEKIITIIREADYKCMSNAKARFEYFSGDMKWNPHIHIMTDVVDNKPASAPAQQIRRKLKDKGIGVYWVNGVTRTGTIHFDYILGKKSEEKLDCCKADEEFRKKFGALELYEI